MNQSWSKYCDVIASNPLGRPDNICGKNDHILIFVGSATNLQDGIVTKDNVPLQYIIVEILYHGDSDKYFAVGFLIYFNVKTACILIKISEVCCPRNKCYSALVKITARHQRNGKVIDWLPSSMTHTCASLDLNNLSTITHPRISLVLQTRRKWRLLDSKYTSPIHPFLDQKSDKICYFLAASLEVLRLWRQCNVIANRNLRKQTARWVDEFL